MIQISKFFQMLKFPMMHMAKVFIIYGGVGGNLQQITYREQSLINPYISPTQKFSSYTYDF